MIAYYAMGAGLGHITRAQAVKEALGLPDKLLLISNSRFLQASPNDCSDEALDLKHTLSQFDIAFPRSEIRNDRHELSRWIYGLLTSKNITEFYIDVFPVGIKGELNGISQQFPSLKLFLISRALKWQAYLPLLSVDNHFECTYLAEKPTDHQLLYIRQQSRKLASLQLPPTTVKEQSVRDHITLPDPPFCTVIHSGSDDEIRRLTEYAQDRMQLSGIKLPIVIVSPSLPNGFEDFRHLKLYPAGPVLSVSSIVVSAAGFNIMREMHNHSAEHWVLPMPRRYDDQFLRAANHRKI